MTDSPALLSETVIRDALRGVYDPEFGVSVQDLGLIYDVILQGGAVSVAMTLTSMYCPAGDVMREGVRAAIAALPGVTEVAVEIVWEPQWNPEMLSDAARTQLGWNG